MNFWGNLTLNIIYITNKVFLFLVYSEDLMEEIKALVLRHPDKLTVGCFDVLKAFFWISFDVLKLWFQWQFLKLWFQWQLDTIKSRNKGYSAEIAVVTYSQKRQETDDMPKFRILLVSFLRFLMCWMTWFPFIRFWLVMAGVFDRWFLVFQSFGQHGRELITSEVALRILSILSKEKFLPNLDQASLDRTLDKLVIKVTTLLNSFSNSYWCSCNFLLPSDIA